MNENNINKIGLLVSLAVALVVGIFALVLLNKITNRPIVKPNYYTTPLNEAEQDTPSFDEQGKG